MNENDDDAFVQRLSRLTPTPAALDRDALLFAAGRASARGSRPLVALASALATSQLLTLVFLWPRAPLPPAEPLSAGASVAVANQDSTPAPPYQLSELRRDLLSAEHDGLRRSTDGCFVPDDPPLRAFDATGPELLN